VAYGLVKDIMAYHVHDCLFSNSSIKKSYDGYSPPSVIVVDFFVPNLVILSGRATKKVGHNLNVANIVKGRAPRGGAYVLPRLARCHRRGDDWRRPRKPRR
jgi:hypothetical protein